MSKRLQIPDLGEYYDDLLKVDARINGRSKALQAQSLLCAKLQEREGRIKERVAYLAAKRGISPDAVFQAIVAGTWEDQDAGETQENQD